MSYDITLRPRKSSRGAVSRQILEKFASSHIHAAEEGAFCLQRCGEIVAKSLGRGRSSAVDCGTLTHSRLASYGEAVQHPAAQIAGTWAGVFR